MKRKNRVLISSALALVVMTFNACGKAIAPQTSGGISSAELASSSSGGTGSTDTSGGGSPSSGGSNTPPGNTSNPPVTNPPITPPVTNPPVIPPPVTAGKITLPIEIYGSDGTTVPIQFDATSSQVTAAKSLYLQVHGLGSIEEASIQLNNGPWVALTDDNLQLYPLEKAYGGIGGGFSTVRGTVTIQSSWLAIGTNTIRFRFNKTDGFTHGYRILAFNLRNASNQDLLSSSLFQQDDPTKWTEPLNNPTDIAAGKNLWYNAQLSTPISPKLNARCTDCHAQDGRDLKYFNYSNFVIKTRAVFHGLTPTQGDQIASYIRSLNQPAPGRPWNPPYQPGPGMDSKPISEWAAGAGLNAVLDNDTDTLKYIFPNGYSDTSRAAYTANLNAREAPVALQLLDWNHWLPQIHPKDGYPSGEFDGSQWNLRYKTIRSMLVPADPKSYLNTRDNLALWSIDRDNLMDLHSAPDRASFTETKARQQYGVKLLHMVKMWETMHEFQLQGLSRTWFGPQADDRAWFGNDAFLTSPGFLKNSSPGMPGIFNGTKASFMFSGQAWYHLQMILNDSNKKQVGTSPIDWGYAHSAIANTGEFSPQAGLYALWLVKGMQISNNGNPPSLKADGWSFEINEMPQMVGLVGLFRSLSINERNLVYQAILRQWINQVNTFTPEQLYSTGKTSQSEVPTENYGEADPMASRWKWLIKTHLEWGVDKGLEGELADWAQKMWPNYQWRAGLGL